MNFGGPVWHASVAQLSGWGYGSIPWTTLRTLARALLVGVGDPGLGEWEHNGEKVFHIRRRLTPDEQALVGPVLDIRRLPEARQRLLAVAAAHPLVPLSWLLAEIERH